MENITGVHIYYYMICKRKLWYFINSLQMENENEYVNLGKIIDENSYAREDKHININNVINIDYIKDDIICETKKSRSIEAAAEMQLKYYLYYLKKNGADGFTGEINYPALRQRVSISINEDDEKMLDGICNEIMKIKAMPLPPEQNKTGKCKKCAYYDLCMI